MSLLFFAMFFFEKTKRGIDQRHYTGSCLTFFGILKAIGVVFARQFFIGLFYFFPRGRRRDFEGFVGVVPLIVVIRILAVGALMSTALLRIPVAILAFVFAVKGFAVIVITRLVAKPSFKFVAQFTVRLVSM